MREFDMQSIVNNAKPVKICVVCAIGVLLMLGAIYRAPTVRVPSFFLCFLTCSYFPYSSGCFGILSGRMRYAPTRGALFLIDVPRGTLEICFDDRRFFVCKNSSALYVLRKNSMTPIKSSPPKE